MNELLDDLAQSIAVVLDEVSIGSGDQALVDQTVELGWTLISCPESIGGLELGVKGVSLASTQVGRRAAKLPLHNVLLGVDALAQCDTESAATYIEWATTTNLLAVPLGSVQLDISDSGTALSGTAVAVDGLTRESLVLVWSKCHTLLALLPVTSSGVVCEAMSTWDQSRRLSTVALNEVTLEPEHVVADGEHAKRIIDRLHAIRDVMLAADTLGAAEALFDETLAHLTVREQFGRPLAMFQALKHRCANLKVDLAGAKALEGQTLDRLSHAAVWQDEQYQLTSQLKSHAHRVGGLVVEDCLQLHGGVGMASEHVCHVFLKRVMLNQQLGSGWSACAEIGARSYLGVGHGSCGDSAQ